MKKVEVKLMSVGASTDLEKELNVEGQSGWKFVHAVQTPLGGVKFMLQRETDEDVELSVRNDELMKKYGI